MPDFDSSISAAMAWFHLATLAGPLLIVIARLEWLDWSEAHPHWRETFHGRWEVPHFQWARH